MDFMFAIFFVILMVVSSLASKMKEKKELERRNKNRRGRQGKNDDLPETTRRVASGNQPARTGSDQVRTARPKDARPVTRRQESVAPGKQLLESLLGDIRQEVDEWVPVEPKSRRELPQSPLEKRHETHSHENVREQAQAAREQHARQVSRSRSSQPPPVHAQRSTPSEPDVQREKRRQEILEERERRKQSRQQQHQKAQQAAKQKSAQSRQSKRTSAPAAHNRYAQWLHSKNTVRNAVVLSEILGPPKSFREDDQRIV
jgi:hypothetical protein